MSNGDDGYSNGGGGGSVWWEVEVSEGKFLNANKGDFTETCPDPKHTTKRPALPNHGRFSVTGHDSFREASINPATEAGYFEITIFDPAQICQIDVDPAFRTLKIYLPISTGNKPVMQYSVKWGIRDKMACVGWAKAMLQAMMTMV